VFNNCQILTFTETDVNSWLTATVEPLLSMPLIPPKSQLHSTIKQVPLWGANTLLSIVARNALNLNDPFHVYNVILI
jgi:hypothetical protein